MSFAAGLVAGQRAAQGAIDAFTQARERRNERRFNEDMAALEAERKERMQVPPPVGSGVLTPQAQQGIDTQLKPLAGTPGTGVLRPEFQNIGTVGLSKMPASANPMSTSEYFQRQAALAGKYNLTDRAERYMAQGLQAQQFEEQQAQYQRDAELRDAQFEEDKRAAIVREEQLDKQLKAQIAALNQRGDLIEANIRDLNHGHLVKTAQLQAGASYQKAMMDPSVNILDAMNSMPEEVKKDSVASAAWQDSFFKKYSADTGITAVDLRSYIQEAQDTVSMFLTPGRYEDEAGQVQAINEKIDELIPDLDNNNATRPMLKQYDGPDGTKIWRIKDGNSVYAEGSTIEELGRTYMKRISGDLALNEAINIREAKKNGAALKILAKETEEAKVEAALEFIKSGGVIQTEKERDQFFVSIGLSAGLSTDGYADTSDVLAGGDGEQATPGLIPSLDAAEAEIAAQARAQQEAAVRQEGINTRLASVTPEVVSRIADRETLQLIICLLYTSPSPRDRQKSRMPSSA